jgi:hypothetical protein
MTCPWYVPAAILIVHVLELLAGTAFTAAWTLVYSAPLPLGPTVSVSEVAALEVEDVVGLLVVAVVEVTDGTDGKLQVG